MERRKGGGTVDLMNKFLFFSCSGGVLPPGAAFAKTNLIAELCKHGFKFEVVNQ